MDAKEMKNLGYEMQGIAMGVKGHLVSLDRFPDQLPSVRDVKNQIVTDLDLLISLAMTVRAELTQ